MTHKGNVQLGTYKIVESAVNNGEVTDIKFESKVTPLTENEFKA